MPTQKPRLSTFSTLAIAVAALASTACTASLSATPAYPVTYDYPVVAVTAPSVRVYDRAPVVYQSSTTYSVGAGWYYPTDGHRVYPRDPYRRHGQPAYTRSEPDRRGRGDGRHKSHGRYN